MKIRHLLLGLMICVAGTGAIGLSGGFLDDQNTTQLTPFLIFGHVLYEGGAPCNSPNVSITNLDTGVAWYADTVSSSNYYQTLLTLADVSAGDVLRWSATDGTVFDTANRTVDQSDLESGGIFYFDVILQSIAPRITGYAPESQIRDIENAARRFNITIDQVVDVTWLVNNSPAQTNESVTDASYTHTNVAIGVWNVSARANNGNGTAMQEWVWNVTTLPLPKIAAFVLPSSVFVIYGNVSYDDVSACNSPFVVITNLNTSEELIADNHTGEAFYQLVTSSAFANAGDVLRINAHKNGAPVGNATHTVSQIDIGNGVIEVDINERHLPDFKVIDVSFDPSEPLLIGDLVTINAMIANSGAEGEASVEFYDNKSITIERILNNYPEIPINDTITFSGALRIRVHFKSFDISPMGNITIHNESQLVEWLNETGTDHWTGWYDGGTIRIESSNAGFTVDRYEAVLANVSRSLGSGDSTNISAKWDLSLQGMGWATNGTHNITVRVDPYDQVIESDEMNNEKIEAIDVGPSLDFAVTKISLDPSEPVLGDVVEVSANISNCGDRDGTTVVGVFYDNKSIEILRNEDRIIDNENKSYTSTDSISLPPDVFGARLHFGSLYVFNGHVDICDKNGRVIERFHGMGANDAAISGWTDCIYGENITVRIELPYDPNLDTSTYRCNYIIDRYEALIAEENVTLNVNESKVANASWRTGVSYGGAREHDITVRVDPRDTSVEINEMNNTLRRQVFVNGTDLTVTAIEISCGDDYCDNPCYVGQDVNVTATIANIGAVDATNFTVIFRDGACFDCTDVNINPSGINFSKVPIERLNSSESRSVSVKWNPLETGHHTITANITYNDTDNNQTNNELFNCSYVEERYDFLVENVNVEPKKAEKGESVNIIATIGSIGHAGGNVSIAFFVNSTDFAGTCGERFTRIRTIDNVYVKVNETETVPIRWDVDVVGGCHLIAAVVNPDNEIEEKYDTVYENDSIIFRGETGNNVKNCTLHVNPLDLDITNITLFPAKPNIGDIVNVSAEIRNNGDVEANSTVWFYMEKNISQPESTYAQKSWSTLQPGDVMMRVHFNHIEWRIGWGAMRAYVNDSQDQRKPVYFYIKNEEGEMIRVDSIDSYKPCMEIDDYGRHWYDVWTDWGYGDTFEIKTHCWNPERISAAKYQVLLGNETVTLGPGESMVYHGTWNTSPPLTPGVNYTLMANAEDQKRYSRETYLGGTDLAVTNLSVKPVVWDGDKVWANVTIENLGRMAATAFSVNFTEVYHPEQVGYVGGKTREASDHLELINTTHIECLGAGNSIHIPVSWNASIREIVCEGTCDGTSCNWTEQRADDYVIKVEIDPFENTNKEVNNTNHIEGASVHVDESRDFEVTNLSFQVNNESRDPSELVIYDDVTLNATLEITNFLNSGGIVNVSFYIDEAEEHEIGNASVAFPAGNGTGYAEIKWIVENFDGVDITGNHDMTVDVDPENRIYEIDDVNNRYTKPIYVMASDILVESLDIYPRNPERGGAVSINVTLANYGAADASDLILQIYDWAERHIEDVDEQSGLGREQIEITRDNATAMRLYLDLEVGGGRVCIKDGSEREIMHYDEKFHGWTPWVLDNSTTIVITDDAYARVSRVYYLESSDIINTSTHNIGVNETTKITVDWNPSVVGERFIAAVVDPENAIIESDESNNRLANFTSVQTADLLVSNLSLAWLNGTEIGENEIIKHGDDVRIAANITNIGIEEVCDFDVRFLVDGLLIKNETTGGLAPDESMNVSLDWNAIVGCHLIKVEVDYKNKIDETNETNNIITLERYVCGAELSGNTSWETLGLHGDILFEPTQPYDEDEVNITATVNNSGYVAATNFSAALFFDYKPYTYHKPANTWGWERWINESYDDAVCIYLNISIRKYHILVIYDRDGREVKRVDRSCWVRVPGDTASVTCGDGYCDRKTQYLSNYTISFYPVYPDNLSQIKELDANSSEKLPPVKQNVSVGDYPIVLFIDPENKVPEDEDYKENNVIYKTMHVKPTRDFTVTNVTGERTNLSDPDTIAITASISNIGLRNGTAEAKIVDYEEEHRTYKYHFDPNCSLSYLPIPPDATLLKSGYADLMIIHRPDVDAINLHFNRITLYQAGQYGPPRGKILICSKTGAKVFGANGSHNSNDDPTIFSDKNILVPGTTAYIYTYRPSFDLDRYTTEKELLKEDVALNASKTWNESKNITSVWTAYTGNHTIAVTLDGDDRTAEINESNNELSPLFHVNASRDPVIVELNFTPVNPDDGDDVNISAVIANNGSKDASFMVDLWADTTQDKCDAEESLPDADLTIDLGDKIRYIRLLKHANLTLAPGENVTVHTTWDDISGFGSPKHHIIAIVDPTDEIDEINESDNEIKKEVIMSYPDLTIGKAHVHGGTGKAVVPIEEIGGISGATDVTVRFEAYETVECKKFIQNWGSIHHDAVNVSMQVYFKHLRAPPPEGRVEVRASTSTRVDSIKTYSGVEFSGKWSPWVEEDTVYIFCQGAGTYAEIDKYRWGNVSDEEIDELDAGEREHVRIPWAYECPRSINVSVDPDNNITEINEDNNNETVLLYADLRAERIVFVSPQDTMLSLDAEKFKIDGYITNGGSEDGIVVPVGDFNVTLEFRNRYPNGTIGEAVFNITEHVEDPLCADEELPIRFEFDPNDKFEIGGNYTVFLIADSSGDVCESSDAYPEEEDKYRLGEWNNFTLENVYVHNTSGYTGGGELINVAEGEVHGRVVYTFGDSKLLGRGREAVYTVNFDDVLPNRADVRDIELARLFVYWYTWHHEGGRLVPVLLDLDMDFNDEHNLKKAGNYSDNPVATKMDGGYGLYSYDVTNCIRKGGNVAAATRGEPTSEGGVYDSGIHAIGLLVVYEDEDEPLTKYWVNEGADIMMAANSVFQTGLPDGDCITTATFDGVERGDTENVNATLLTVLGFYVQYGGSSDALEFNDHSIGSRIGTGYWEHQTPARVALTKNEWEDVTDHLKRGDNLAEIHSLGNYMMPNNAFLRLIFPPDLNIIDLTAPASTVVGAHHSINATIRNDGRSDAHDFNVTFCIDRKQMVRIPHLDLPAGENMTIHLYNWTPMLLLHSYNLTVAADVLSGEDWTEVETDNNAMTKHVTIEEGGFGNQTGPRGTGGGSNPTGGEYTETITGRVMEGMKFSTFGGGGGAGMFSALEWIMKGAVWFVLVLFVGLGYRMEQRSYGRASDGYATS